MTLFFYVSYTRRLHDCTAGMSFYCIQICTPNSAAWGRRKCLCGPLVTFADSRDGDFSVTQTLEGGGGTFAS